MKCAVCGEREAVILQRHTGKPLCVNCFERDLIRRVNNEVRRYGMFTYNDRVLLALSGGKDSFTLLNILVRIHPTSNIGIITIIEGIPNYNRLSDIAWIRNASKSYGIDHHIVSFKEYLGYDLSELVELSHSSRVNISPCTYCGIIRRRIMNEVALELGYSRVATAHNLDDEVQTVIMDLLRGDMGRLIQLHPLSTTLSKEFVKRVKPMRRIFEYEVTQYAFLKGFKFQERDCPYITSRPTIRAKIRDFLLGLEAINPRLLLNIINWYDSLISELLKRESINKLPELPKCPLCGSPMSYGRRYCSLCDLLIKLGIDVKGLKPYKIGHLKAVGRGVDGNSRP